MRTTFFGLLIVVALIALGTPAPAQADLNACFEYACTCGGACSFDASCSSGDIVQYIWDFDDGNYGSGEISYHTFNQSGQYTVSLVVNNGIPVGQPGWEIDYVEETITIGCD
jgi:hypothetical protein